MDKKLGLLILLGLAIGASFGVVMGTAIGNIPFGIAFGALGALGGLFLGSSIAAAVLENENAKKRK